MQIQVRDEGGKPRPRRAEALGPSVGRAAELHGAACRLLGRTPARGACAEAGLPEDGAFAPVSGTCTPRVNTRPRGPLRAERDTGMLRVLPPSVGQKHSVFTGIDGCSGVVAIIPCCHPVASGALTVLSKHRMPQPDGPAHSGTGYEHA
eukprot:270827-Chlamydomonas_euryale.AAC.5